MASIFAKQADITQHPNRNNFPLTHNVYGTYKAGYLYPNFCYLMPPTSSIRARTDLFMNFMPTAYPLQSRMRIIQHYFAVPLRLLWKDFENWSMGLAPDAVPPYIDQPAESFYTGSLYDYLRVPTTIVSDEPIDVGVTFRDILPNGSDGTPNWQMLHQYFFPTGEAYKVNGSEDYNLFNRPNNEIVEDTNPKCTQAYMVMGVNNHSSFPDSRNIQSGNGWQYDETNPKHDTLVGFQLSVHDFSFSVRSGQKLKFNVLRKDFFRIEGLADAFLAVFIDDGTNSFYFKGRFGRAVYNDGEFDGVEIDDYVAPAFSEMMAQYQGEYVRMFLVFHLDENPVYFKGLPGYGLTVPMSITEPVEMSSIDGVNPFYGRLNDGSDTERLSAMAPRAYEMIYNSFYRNKTGNQPFVVNGKTIYNDWLPTHEGGSDTYEYKLHRRNWEFDAYTSCLPSPQMGQAPLVGITDLNALGQIRYTNSDGSTTTIGEYDGTSVRVVDRNLNLEQQRSLVNLASTGISIADFRQTNALQNFLEQTLRTGLTYYDFIRGHFGKGPKKAELQMPEFLGGTAVNVDVNMISNTNAAAEPLGSYAGQASAFGQAKHHVNFYADDFTIIMGIMCIVPDPAYSQLLAPHWKLNDPLDLYFPEFGQLGMQPVTYGEMCPIQSKVDSLSDPNKKLTDVFGYQRPNHNMVWMPDSLHGEFRKSLNRYVVNRRFAKRPELGDEFLKIDPAEVSRSFVVTTAEAGSGDDIAVGQIRHEVVCKQPVHRIVVPSLGR